MAGSQLHHSLPVFNWQDRHPWYSCDIKFHTTQGQSVGASRDTKASHLHSLLYSPCGLNFCQLDGEIESWTAVTCSQFPSYALSPDRLPEQQGASVPSFEKFTELPECQLISQEAVPD